MAPLAATAEEMTSPITFGTATTLVSDYAFRGISQSDEGMALQGEFSAEHESGLYGSIWASSIDFNNNNAGSIEVDATIGYGMDLGADFTLDLGAIQYMYPGSDDSLNYDYTEMFVALGRDFGKVSTSIGINYSPEYFGKSGEFFYYSAGASMDITERFSIAASIGYNDIDDNATFGTPDYTDWSLGVEYDLGEGFAAGLTYVDTDLEKADCADGCEGRGILSLSRSF